MGNRIVTLDELAGDNVLEIGAGRPRSEGAELPVLKVADVLEGRVQAPSQTRESTISPQIMGPKVSRPGDVVLTTKGTVGRVAIMPSGGPTFAYSPQLCYFRPVENGPLHSRYLYYWFKSAEFSGQAAALKGQTDMADFMSLRDMTSLTMTLPNVTEQRAIAEVLGALDDKIAANDSVISATDTLAKWTWIRAVSDCAHTAPLSSLARFVNGRPFTKGASGSGRIVIRIAELNSGIGESTIYNDIDVDEDNLARPGDLLFAWSGSLTVARWFRKEAIVNQHIFKVIPNEGKPMWLVNQAVRAKLREFQAIAADKATTMGHIQRRHLDEPVPVPNEDQLKQMGTLMSGLWDRALAAEQEKFCLESARDELLPLLMSGKVRVRDAEKVVEEVV